MNLIYSLYTHTHTHTHIYIYIYICFPLVPSIYIRIFTYHLSTKSVSTSGNLFGGKEGTGSLTICCNNSKMDNGLPSGGNGNRASANSIKVIPNDQTSDLTE